MYSQLPRFRVRAAGFSLVELLVVLVISVTVVAITTVAYSKLSTNVYLKSTTRHIAASIRYARNYALVKGTEGVFQINVPQRTYSYSGSDGKFQFKSNIDFEVYSSDFANRRSDIAEIRFAPDGSSSGGKITLSSRNKTYVVHVDWLTGKVAIDG